VPRGIEAAADTGTGERKRLEDAALRLHRVDRRRRAFDFFSQSGRVVECLASC
jgi:hypothetical protein